jgi:hypothetical protein
MTTTDLTANAGPEPRMLTRRGLLKGGLGLAATGGLILPATGARAAVVAANELVITDYRISPSAWPKGQRLTITVIADLHAGGPNMGRERVRQVVDAANELGSDLTVVLGDFFATHRFITERVPHPVWAAELSGLHAPLGVYSILGNHDWWNDISAVRHALDKVRLPVMQNDVVLLGAPGQRFWLAGLGDQIAHRLGPNNFKGVDDLPGTLSRIRTNEPVILLAHEPDIFTEVPARVALTIAGHTHGGQIRLPYAPPFWVPSAYGSRFAYGHIVESDRHLIVSGGLGCSGVPLRLGVPPEIVRITLA